MSLSPSKISEKTMAAIAAAISISLIVFLLITRFIGEVTFAALFSVTSLTCLCIAFSDRLESGSLKDLSFKLTKMEETQQAVIAKQTEPKQTASTGLIVESYCTDSKSDQVIRALGSSSYAFRSIEGVAKEIGLPSNDVENSINWLIANKFAVESTGIGGNVYSLLPKAYEVFSSKLTPCKT